MGERPVRQGPRDIVGLYVDSPDKALMLCWGEESQIQDLNRTAPFMPVLPTTPARMTHDYVRHGTASMSATFSAAAAR